MRIADDLAGTPSRVSYGYAGGLMGRDAASDTCGSISVSRSPVLDLPAGTNPVGYAGGKRPLFQKTEVQPSAASPASTRLGNGWGRGSQRPSKRRVIEVRTAMERGQKASSAGSRSSRWQITAPLMGPRLPSGSSASPSSTLGRPETSQWFLGGPRWRSTERSTTTSS